MADIIADHMTLRRVFGKLLSKEYRSSLVKMTIFVEKRERRELFLTGTKRQKAW
jgi:hypothetical protein